MNRAARQHLIALAGLFWLGQLIRTCSRCDGMGTVGSAGPIPAHAESRWTDSKGRVRVSPASPASFGFIEWTCPECGGEGRLPFRVRRGRGAR